MHTNKSNRSDCDKDDDDNNDNRSLLSPSSYHEMPATVDDNERAGSVAAAGTQS